MKNIKFALAAAALLAAGTARAGEDKLDTMRRITLETEAKIQAQVLDSVLGKGKAWAFLTMEAELLSRSRSEAKSGTGEMQSSKEEGKSKADAKSQKQTAVQDKKEAESRRGYSLAPLSLKLRVLHDASVPAEKLKAVKEALAALYPGALKPEDIVFVPAAFAAGQ